MIRSHDFCSVSPPSLSRSALRVFSSGHGRPAGGTETNRSETGYHRAGQDRDIMMMPTLRFKLEDTMIRVTGNFSEGRLKLESTPGPRAAAI
jgi:hypothetical protein